MAALLAKLNMHISYSSLATSNKSVTKDSFHRDIFKFSPNNPAYFIRGFGMLKVTTLMYVRPIKSPQNFANHHFVTA